MILRDFRCKSCDLIREELVQSHTRNIKCECGGLMKIHYLAMKTQGIDSFNPHYDLQLGQFFASSEEKQTYLTKNNWAQATGKSSPRKDSGVETLCSKDQFKQNGKRL